MKGKLHTAQLTDTEKHKIQCALASFLYCINAMFHKKIPTPFTKSLTQFPSPPKPKQL